jgi:hypothetical protein
MRGFAAACVDIGRYKLNVRAVFGNKGDSSAFFCHDTGLVGAYSCSRAYDYCCFSFKSVQEICSS